ncbi:hypothetical protein BH11PSE2_BH11PSE2_02030 [soil metagenome]
MEDRFGKLLDDAGPANERLALARALLKPVKRRDQAWPALAAAAFFAVSALTFAVGAILAPPVDAPAAAKPALKP